MNKKTVADVDIRDKRVIMRVDFNVPIDDGQITDDTRIRAALPTIEYIRKQNAKLILMSHLGRPSGTGYEEEYSLKPVARRLSELLGMDVIMAPDCVGDEVAKLAKQLSPGGVILLENTRFYAEEVGKVEAEGLSAEAMSQAKSQLKAKQKVMAQRLGALGDVFVNDAFGAAHRAHASTSVIAQYVSVAVAGFLMEKELTFLGKAVEDPQRPFVAIIGGAKISGKLELLRNLIGKVDTVIIGGGMAYTFQKALGKKVARSIVENDLIDTAKETMNIAKAAGKKLLLPVDNVIADQFSEKANTQIVAGDFPDGWEGVDIGPQTIQLFSDEIRRAKTILWNGPMGCFEMEPFSKGTNAIGQAVAMANAVSIIGGGDSVSAVKKAGLYDKMTHVSTGGGASLEFLEGRLLPGVAALNDR